MHMNQVAIAYRTAAQRLAIIQSLGLSDADWIKDRVTAHVKVLGRNGDYTNGKNVAELEFCMAMGGTQFELIRYVDGPNWINEAARIGMAFPMVAHVGFHLDENEDWPPIVANGVLAQEAITVEHSNDAVNEAGRRYHYRIYRVGVGAYFKFIKRLTVGKDHHEAVEGLEQRKPAEERYAFAVNDEKPLAPVPPANPGLADADHPTTDAAKEASEQAIKDAEARAAKEDERRAADEQLRREAAGEPADPDRKVGGATTETGETTGGATEGNDHADGAAEPHADTAENTGNAGAASERTATENGGAKEPQPQVAKPGPAPSTHYKGKRK